MKIFVLYICMLLGASVFCFGQTTQISMVQSVPGDVFTDTTYDSSGNPELLVRADKHLYCELSDTINIATLRIKLGSAEGQSDLLNQNFAFGGQIISETLYLERFGLECRFRLGSFTNRDFAYLSIEALSSGGALITSWQGLLN